MKHPQILTLNLDPEISAHLIAQELHIYEGNLGKLVRMNMRYNGYLKCRPNQDLPADLHEYEVVILDLTTEEIIDHIPEDHERSYNKSTTDFYFKCEHPQTIFDPRAVSLSWYDNDLQRILVDGGLQVVFCAAYEEISYTLMTEHGEQETTNSLYDFAVPYLPGHENKHGKQTSVPDKEDNLYRLMRKYQQGMSYDIIFEYPHIHQGNTRVPDPNFYPLLTNKRGDILSFFKPIGDDSGVFFFPQVADKKAFLTEFLLDVAPSMFPALFPDIVKNAWVYEPTYALPNQERLIDEQLALEQEYQQKMAAKVEEIAENAERFGFLHDLLTETDITLVTATIKFLEWLGFENVRDGDEFNEGNLKQEDIRIDTPAGLLVFEVKGLGGTSKDSDCNQINKVKIRKMRERNSMDVYGIYIVNHQRHLPPLKRDHPPFKPVQITDAVDEERGLLTTWQLFQLYQEIENGVISKEQARQAFYQYGLLKFIPRSYPLIGWPVELLQGRTIVIMDIPENITVNVGAELLIADKEGLHKVKVLSIKVADAHVTSATNVEAGLKIDRQIAKASEIYLVVQT